MRGWAGDISLNLFCFFDTFRQTSQNKKHKKFRPMERDSGEATHETWVWKWSTMQRARVHKHHDQVSQARRCKGGITLFEQRGRGLIQINVQNPDFCNPQELNDIQHVCWHKIRARSLYNVAVALGKISWYHSYPSISQPHARKFVVGSIHPNGVNTLRRTWAK